MCKKKTGSNGAARPIQNDTASKTLSIIKEKIAEYDNGVQKSETPLKIWGGGCQ